MKIINIPNNNIETNKFCKLFSIPKNSGLWGSFYGRYDFEFDVQVSSSNHTYFCKYVLHINNNNVELVPLNTPNIDIAYKVNDNFIDIYVRMPSQNYRGFIYCKNFISITPKINTQYDTTIDTLNVLCYNNITGKTFTYTDDNYQVNLLFQTVGNFIFVTGTCKIINEKSTTGFTNFGDVDISLIPSVLKQIIANNHDNNIILQINNDGKLRIIQTAQEGTYFVNYFYNK